MDVNRIIDRVDFLINQGNQTLLTQWTGSGGAKYVNRGGFSGFRSASLSFIGQLFGVENTYYKEFNSSCSDHYKTHAESGINILISIKNELENGWLTSYRQLVTADIFSDFLEMSKYLLDEKYKDPAAVMVGSVLEEHLRQLCKNHAIEITFIKGNDLIPKKADVINSDLVKAGVYGVLEQKQVTSWLHLRNSSAHGKYNDYTIDQVNLMYNGVLDFIIKTK